MKRTMILAIALVAALLTASVGGTIAWFTDEVASTGNKIESGILDLKLYQLNGTEWTDISDSTNALFSGNLWEPGYTAYQVLKVENAGNLAFKWKTEIVCEGEMSKLAEAIDVYTKVGVTELPTTRDEIAGWTKEDTLAGFIANSDTKTIGALDKNGDYATLGIALKMREEAGNEYQGLTLGDLDIKILATQNTFESDSFGSDYDADATFYQAVSTKEELVAALNAGQSVSLTENMELTDEPITIAKDADVVLDLNGKTLSGVATNAGTSKLINVAGGAELTITGSGTITFEATKPDTDWGENGTKPYPGYANNTITNSGKLVIDGVTIENKTAKGGASYAIDNYPGAELIINSGKVIQSGGDIAIRTFCNSGTVPVNVTINGGEISGKRAIWIQLPSNNSNVAPDMNLTVNGGTLASTDDANANYLAIYSYSYGNSFKNVDVVFNGGTFNGHVAFGGGYKGDKENVTVNGGTFKGDLGRYLANDGWEDIAKP